MKTDLVTKVTGDRKKTKLEGVSGFQYVFQYYKNWLKVILVISFNVEKCSNNIAVIAHINIRHRSVKSYFIVASYLFPKCYRSQV